MKKRILSLFLAALMVLTLVPFTGGLVPKALAGKLPGTTIYYTVPAIGKTTDDMSFSGQVTASFDVSMSWYVVSPKTMKESPMIKGAAFGEGMYIVKFDLTPKSGVTFDDKFDLVIGNTYKGGNTPRITIDAQNQKITFSQAFQLSKTISTLKLSAGIEPKPFGDATTKSAYVQDENGNNVSSDTAEIPKVTIDKGTWYKGASTQSPHNSQWLLETAKFQEGQIYTFRFEISTREPYVFAEKMTFQCATTADVVIRSYKKDADTYLVDLTFNPAGLEIINVASAKNIQQPIIGETVVHTGDSANPTAYKVVDVEWLLEERLDEYYPLPDGAKFEKGKAYMLSISFQANEGYAFSNNVSYEILDSNKQVVDSWGADHMGSTTTCRFEIHIDPVVGINIVTAKNIQQPIIGETIGNSGDSANPEAYEVVDVEWLLEEKLDEYYPLPDGAKFEKGKAYMLSVSFQAKSGYAFTKDVTYEIKDSNGQIVDSWGADRRASATTCRFEIHIDPVVGINIVTAKNIQQPIIGETIGNSGDSANPEAYEVVDVEWLLEEKLDEYYPLPDGAKFEKGKAYMLSVSFQAKSGYAFTKDVTYEIKDSNGQIVDSWGADRRASATTCRFEIHIDPIEKAPEPEFKPGDVDGNGKIETKDARLALRCSIGLEKYEAGSPEYLACDVNKDGKVGTDDARFILRKSVGLKDPEITWE